MSDATSTAKRNRFSSQRKTAAVLRLIGGEWHRGTLYPHAEREPSLGATLLHRCGAGRGHPGAQSALQRAMADRASRLPAARAGAG